MSFAGLEEWLQVEKFPGGPWKIVGSNMAGSHRGPYDRTIFTPLAQALNIVDLALPIEELREVNNR